MFYTISDLERLSGIQSHTIRIWEQRYQALKPQRTQGNKRFYQDEDLKRLLNIVSLNESGLKISKICSLTDHAIAALLENQYEAKTTNNKAEFYITQLIKCGIAFDSLTFNHLLAECISKIGIADAYKQVLYPLLVRLGLMWRKDDICPAHEHFISNIIRQKFFSAINNLSLEKPNGQTWVLLLPEDEDHDIGLLLAHYMLRANKQKVIYLGSNVPLDSLKKVIETTKVDRVMLFMVRSRSVEVAQNYVNSLSEICDSATIHLAGNSSVIGKMKNIDHIKLFKTLEEFEQLIPNSN